MKFTKTPRDLRSTREIELMRAAGQVVWEAHQAAAKKVKPGATTREVDDAVAEVFRRAAATPLFKNYPHPQRGRPPFPAVTCISVNEEVVHGIPGDRVLKEGDIVSLDTGCRVDGWCGDAAVTHPVGQIAEPVRRLLDVTRGVLNLAIELMGQKSHWSDVAAEMQKYVADHRFTTVECFVGHGIGRKMHEEPQVPNFCTPQFRRRHDFPLEPGLVIAVEPMVNMGSKNVRIYSDHWTQGAVDGLPSAHFEHTIAMTADGPMVLTDGKGREKG